MKPIRWETNLSVKYPFIDISRIFLLTRLLWMTNKNALLLNPSIKHRKMRKEIWSTAVFKFLCHKNCSFAWISSSVSLNLNLFGTSRFVQYKSTGVLSQMLFSDRDPLVNNEYPSKMRLLTNWRPLLCVFRVSVRRNYINFWTTRRFLLKQLYYGPGVSLNVTRAVIGWFVITWIWLH